MKRFIALTVIVVSLFCPYFARADTAQLAVSSNPPVVSISNPPVPDITDWKVVNMSRTALNVSDVTVAYLGLEIEYSNPSNPREFVRIIKRHIPLIVSKQNKPDIRLLAEMASVFYTKKEEQDRLLEISKKSDPIIYTRWRTKDNAHTGHDTLDGDFDVWLLSSKGDWTFAKNQEIKIEFMTENVGNGKPHNVFSGMKYQVGDVYHIIRIDRNDLLKLFKGEK
ncbi:MAG: hypothetical protein Q7S43_02110 [bacterium]|nr:hypothetical protein [bacterium]